MVVHVTSPKIRESRQADLWVLGQPRKPELCRETLSQKRKQNNEGIKEERSDKKISHTYVFCLWFTDVI